MCSLSMKPQYENWCNCRVVRLFSLWMTPGPDLYLSFFLFCHSFCFPFPPIDTVHANLLSVSLCAAYSPVLYSLCPPQPHRPDLLPLLDEERSFCLPPAAVTWHHAEGDNESDKPAVSVTLLHKCVSLCVLGINFTGREKQTLFFILYYFLFTLSYARGWKGITVLDDMLHWHVYLLWSRRDPNMNNKPLAVFLPAFLARLGPAW